MTAEKKILQDLENCSNLPYRWRAYEMSMQQAGEFDITALSFECSAV
jgi:hypothetical protein